MGYMNPNSNKDKKEKEEKKKASKDKSKLNNALLREFKPLILWATATGILVGGSLYYTNGINPDTKISQYAQIGSLSDKESQMVTLASQVGSSEANVLNEKNKLASLQSDLQSQDKVKTPLSQGYFFISYLTYLTDKYEVNLDDLKVLANDGVTEVDLTADPNLVGSFDLLPINVKLTADFKKMQLMFAEMYTKRIILVKELNMKNNFDSTVTAEFKVFFTDLQMQTDPATGQPIVTDPNAQPQIDPNTGQPMVTDPNANIDPNTGQPFITDPNAQPVDPNAQVADPNATVDPNAQAVDPSTGQPVTQDQTSTEGGGQ